MTSQLTKELISCKKRIIIITYLFQGSILESFLKLKGFEIQKVLEDIGIVEQSLGVCCKQNNFIALRQKDAR